MGGAHTCACTRTHACSMVTWVQWIQRLKEGIRPHGAEITALVSCLSHMLGTEHRSSGKPITSFNWWAIFPAPQTLEILNIKALCLFIKKFKSNLNMPCLLTTVWPKVRAWPAAGVFSRPCWALQLSPGDGSSVSWCQTLPSVSGLFVYKLYTASYIH